MNKPIRNLIIPAIILMTSLFGNILKAQTLVQVGAGEYSTVYRASNGHVYGTKWGGGTPSVFDFGLINVTDVYGAQYTSIAVNSSGQVYVLGVNSNTGVASADLIPTDNLGNAFTGNTKVYALFKTYFSLRNGTIWTWGEDIMNINGGAVMPTPRQLTQPSGKTFTKLALIRYSTASVLALASDGTVYKYEGTSTPTQVNVSGTAINITGIGNGVFIVETTTDLIAWGYIASYVGLSNLLNTPTSIKARWTAAGCSFPVKEMVGNFNTIHIIDANDNLFASGSNACGEIGNGIEYNPYRTRANAPWLWNLNGGELNTGVTQLPGKYKNFNSGTTIAFYCYVQDMGNNWYSWGRNKALTLGNGITLSMNDYAIYPNGIDVPAPRMVTPLTTTWTVAPAFNPNSAKAPLANAGINQYINTNTTALYGNWSSQQEITITSYLWTKVSGTGNITSPSSINTTVTGLAGGTSVFRLTVTNSNGVKDSRDVSVIVNGAPPVNQSPVANAGTDLNITLPVSIATLTGTGTDPDGIIISYQWSQISGPAGSTIPILTTAISVVTSLIQGTYLFELKVTDNAGAIGKDTVQVKINGITLPVPPPTTSGKTVFVNISDGTTSYNNTQWNNWKPVSVVTSSNFLYSDATQSTINASISAQPGFSDNGTSYATTATVCPSSVLRINSVATFGRDLTIKGLDATKKYNFEFYASRANVASSTIFKIGNKSDTITTNNNSSDYAKFTNITPDQSGKVVINLINKGTYQYLAGFSINEPGSAAIGFVNSTAAATRTEVVIPDIDKNSNVNEIASLTVFPNPFINYIQVQLTEKIDEEYIVSLIDNAGRILFNKISNRNNENINTPNLPKGVYYIQVVYKGKKSIRKLIKQ